jgi:peptide/nickel transport system substrate-binding protein
MIGRRRFGIGGAALAVTTGFNRGARAQPATTVLRVVPQAEPQVFDPHQSGVNATQEHAALIYDTLFSWDADMVARPQMVDTWSKSDDGLIYNFTLRPGLKFHDLTPVTSRDVVATLRRLLVRDTQNQILPDWSHLSRPRTNAGLHCN